MFATIEKQLKQLESNKVSLKRKMEICQEVETSLKAIDRLVSQSLSGGSGGTEVDIDTIDSVMEQLNTDLSAFREEFETTMDLAKMVELKQKIQACKEFFNDTGDLTISLADDEGALTDITKKIKDGMLIQQIDE